MSSGGGSDSGEAAATVADAGADAGAGDSGAALLRAELLCGEVLAGGRPCSGGEAEAALRVAWPPGAAPQPAAVDGVCAAVLERAGMRWAYRDASGLCGLYVQPQPDGRWRVASGLEAFAGAAAGGLRIDRQALHEFLRLLDVAAPRSWLQGVRAVEPGQLLRLPPGQAAVAEAPWAPPAAAPPPDFEAALDALDSRLQASVAARRPAGAPVAAFLSGGVDSALICATAARQPGVTTAVTVGFDGAGFDEAPRAARIAAHLGLPHEVLRFDRADYLRAFERLARGMDQPMADPATMATLLAFEHCRARHALVLDGTGADEAVGALPPRHVRLGVGVAGRLPLRLRHALLRGVRRLPVLARYAPILDFEHPAELLSRWQGYRRAEIEELCGEPVALEHTTFYLTCARYAPGAHFERYSALLEAMPGDRLVQATRLSGLRVRYPYCAHEVGAFLRQLPAPWRHAPGRPKRILRELLARHLPRELCAAPKQGLTFPLHDFLAGEGHALVHRHVLEGRWLRRGLLRAEVVRRHARQYIDGDRRLLFRIWALVVLGAWLDHHEHLT